MILHLRRGLRPPGERFRLNPEELRQKWLAGTRERPLELVLADFHGVRRQLVRQIQETSDQDLLRTPPQKWMNGRSLAEWIAADTFSREAVEAERIRRWRSAEARISDGGNHAEPNDR